MSTVRELFSGHRPIDRPIEKVIDYAAADDVRLAAEIDEYEATPNVEENFQKFLDLYGAALDRGQVTEIGVWVSGFYGSGKSSFTKYLGLALDYDCKVQGRPFRELLSERFSSVALRAQLATIATKHRTAVIMLDLGAEQLVETTSATVSSVLYRKVLEWAGYSREKKLADLEFTLERAGKLDAFRAAYTQRHNDDWQEVHNQPLIGVARAAAVVPQFLPDEFPDAEAFRQLRFEEALDTRDVAKRIIDLVHRRTHADAILILIDEAGQYVAPRGELILNLDGLARTLKEEGKGRVWVVATGQQTLAEIVSKAAYNSQELNKLRDRFPIGLQLTARDIREITYRRLLTKSADGSRHLRDLLGHSIGSLLTHTRLTETSLYGHDPDLDNLVQFYPFLPQHFDLLLELVKNLARSTGGIGLRSAIRVIQDLLVDASRSLPPDVKPLADRSVGTLSCADDFYDTLRNDIEKVLPHVVAGVDKSASIFPQDGLVARVVKAIAILQVIEGFPRSRENIAALLYPGVGAAGLTEAVSGAITRLISARESGVIEDPQTGGVGFVSDAIARLRDQRERYVPSGYETAAQRTKVLQDTFPAGVSATLLNVKTIAAGVQYGRYARIVDGGDLTLVLEPSEPALLDQRRTDLLALTNAADWRQSIAWLFILPAEVDDLLAEMVRSEVILRAMSAGEADRDIAQFVRSERNRLEGDRARARGLMETGLQAGAFIYRGLARPAQEKGTTIDTASRAMVEEVGARLYDKLQLAPYRASTDMAAKFLEVEDLRRMPSERDPMKLVQTGGGQARVAVSAPALAEALRVFKEKVAEAGAGRLQGNAIMDVFLAPPYGWTKDTTRYFFAALLRAGEIEVHTPGGLVKTAGPKAREAFRSTVEFGRAGVALRDTRLPLDALDRAATSLQRILGEDVLPLEDRIAETVRTRFPSILERLGPLPDRLRLLGLAGSDRAQRVLQDCMDLLAGDAGDAAARLGQRESTMEADIRWADATVRSLTEGGENDVRRAAGALNDLAELALTDPDVTASLAVDEVVSNIIDVLKSEGLPEQLPALRTALGKVEKAIKSADAQASRALEDGVGEAQKRIESMPEWVFLRDEDRAEIAERLNAQVAALAAAGLLPSGHLKAVLGARARLHRLEDELMKEVRLRAPQEPSDGRIVRVRPGELLGRAVIRSDTVEPWLSSVRERAESYLSEADELHIEEAPS